MQKLEKSNRNMVLINERKKRLEKKYKEKRIEIGINIYCYFVDMHVQHEKYACFYLLKVPYFHL